MDFNVRNIQSSRARQRTFYERFMEKEGVPVVEGFGVTDVGSLQFKPWKRLGCDGAYLQFRGPEGFTGVYVGRLAAGRRQTLRAPSVREDHLYSAGRRRCGNPTARPRAAKHFWQTGSLFSPPMNVLHRLINHGSQPAFFLAITTAPMALDHYHNEDFIFNSDFAFNDRYDGEAGYFDRR